MKVEYTGTQGDSQKCISFVVSASKVNCGQYSFASLVHNIQSRCPSLDFLNERTMRLRYLDDEDSCLLYKYRDLHSKKDRDKNSLFTLEKPADWSYDFFH